MKPIALEKKERLAKLVADAAKKATETALSNFEATDTLYSDNIGRFLKRDQTLASRVQTFVDQTVTEMIENLSGCVKLISGDETLTIGPTTGKRTLIQAEDLCRFTDSDGFSMRGKLVEPDGLDQVAKPTKATNVVVCEIAKDGSIFSGLSDNCDALCLTQDQIIEFVQKHRKWLHTEPKRRTLFVAKKPSRYKEFYIISFCYHCGLKDLPFARYSCVEYGHGRSSYSDHSRVVIPQLALAV